MLCSPMIACRNLTARPALLPPSLSHACQLLRVYAGTLEPLDQVRTLRKHFSLSPLDSVLTPKPPASPLESAFTKNNRGWGYLPQPSRLLKVWVPQHSRAQLAPRIKLPSGSRSILSEVYRLF